MNEILKYDPEFTESQFKTYVDNIFIQIHMAIVTKQLENIKHFVSDEIYNKYQNIVDKLKENHQIQMYDEINVAQTDIVNYKITEEEMIIEVNLISRYLDYIMDENGNYIQGNNENRIEKINLLTFSKKINHKKTKNVRKCPGCGASIDVNATGKCAYCGTIYNLSDKDWILTFINEG